MTDGILFFDTTDKYHPFFVRYMKGEGVQWHELDGAVTEPKARKMAAEAGFNITQFIRL